MAFREYEDRCSERVINRQRVCASLNECIGLLTSFENGFAINGRRATDVYRSLTQIARTADVPFLGHPLKDQRSVCPSKTEGIGHHIGSLSALGWFSTRRKVQAVSTVSRLVIGGAT